jgi:hypothetical protein
MAPIGLTQGALAEAIGVQRKHVNELCNDRRCAASCGGGLMGGGDGTHPSVTDEFCVFKPAAKQTGLAATVTLS